MSDYALMHFPSSAPAIAQCAAMQPSCYLMSFIDGQSLKQKKRQPKEVGAIKYL